MRQISAPRLVCILNLMTLSAFVNGEQEYVPHGVHQPVQEDHYQAAHHNVEFDHEAVLGSVQDNEEFAELPPHEAKKRLATLIDKMDIDVDGYISEQELTVWITKSFVELNKDEALSKMYTQDKNNDSMVTWVEYLSAIYGYTPDELYDMSKDLNPQVQVFAKMVKEDKNHFTTADLNKDMQLDPGEYAAFLNPYDFPHMQEYELDRTLKDYDTNKDSFVDFKEYLGESPGSAEMQIVDKENFDDYDKNGDGRLDRNELRAWILPDLRNSINEEVEHLFVETDLDKDDRLSKQEILDQHMFWVGSAVTDYGSQLHKHDPQEL